MKAGNVPVVVFYTDNGLGLGHLTRLAAVATRAAGRFAPLFVTMSAGFTLLQNLGLAAEYFPSYGRLGITKREWEPLIASRLAEAISLFDVKAVVVDHVSPPRVFDELRAQFPNVTFIWSRRGLWQQDKNAGALPQGSSFDLVIEPGDLASPIDRGPTTQFRGSTTNTEPIVLIDRKDWLPRDKARELLNLPKDGRVVLVNLGDADQAELERMIAHTRSVVTQVSADTTHLFAPLHPLHTEEATPAEGLHRLPVYPVGRFLNAFDGAISTAGYNSFHEITGGGLPAVFVPHRGASIDDQRRRAEFASLCGRARWAPSVFDDDFGEAVEAMLHPAESKIAAAISGTLGGMRGAQQFADTLSVIATESQEAGIGHPQPAEAPTVGHGKRSGGDKKLLIATHLDDDDLARLAVRTDERDLKKMVMAVSHGDPKPLYDRGAVFESILTDGEWSGLGAGDYDEYVERRLDGIRERLGVSETDTAVGVANRQGRDEDR